MLEESAMEKKANNRTSSVPPKQSGAESKKTDNSQSRQYNRYSKRRENNGNKSYYQEPSQKCPTLQKNRISVDKRPRSRSGGFLREDVTEEYHAEYGSPLYNGKKVNLNHLLNFSYARTDDYVDTHHCNSGTSYCKKGKSRVSYNKEQFLQANCQFVVKEGEDYSIHNIDPDRLVDWEHVELIKVNSHEISSCPICLEQPLAAKMTRCGHVYCWPCILHYLALGEKTWRKCPICYESVHEKDLKSVVSQEVHKYQVGETITMSLMKREKGTTYALPKEMWEKKEGKIHNFNDNKNKTSFLKLLSISEDDVQKIVINEERNALLFKLTEAETSEVAFIDSALHLLKKREQAKEGSAFSIDRTFASEQSKLDQQEQSLTNLKLLPTTKVEDFVSALSDEDEIDKSAKELPISDRLKIKVTHDSSSDLAEPSEESDYDDSILKPFSNAAGANRILNKDLASQLTDNQKRQSSPIELIQDSLPVEEAAADLEMPSIPDDQPKKKRQLSDDAFYFYQASDGQHIYLHALNARCLVKEYGALNNCPATITANIVQMENVFMSEELRKRLRYLGHLPLTCEFVVAELVLKSPVLSKETLKFFSDEIDKRRRLRQKKSREEKRWTRRAQDAENKKMAKYNVYGTDSRIVHSQFMSNVISENRPASPSAKSDDSIQSLSSVNTPVGSPIGFLSSEEGHGQQTSNFSFAQMLKVGSSKKPDWSKMKNKLDELLPSTSKSKDSEDSDNEDKVPIPVFQDSFGDAIQTALDTHMAKSKDEPSFTDITDKFSGKKKKKQQKLLLFTTSMARGGK